MKEKLAYLVETERLKLRSFILEDTEAMYELNSDPEVMRWTGDVPFESVDAAREFLKAYDPYSVHGYGRWAVIRKEDGRFIGWSGIKYHKEADYVDLGYRFFRSAWAKGHASEAGKAVIGLAFQKFELESLVGRVARENTASIRVLEKLGFTFWKEAACESIVDALYYKLEKTQTN
jgi:ribosomal-protein-alanine N-acetyltransferase